MVRHDIKEKEYMWQKKRRRSADTGKKTDRRRKVVDGIIIQDYERRTESDVPHDGEIQHSPDQFQVVICSSRG